MKMNIFTLTLLSLIIETTISCTENKTDLQNNNLMPKLLWKSPISEGEIVNGLTPLIYYKKGIVCNGQTQYPNIERLMFIDNQNGNQIWEWSDLRTRKEHLFAPYSMKIAQDILLLKNGKKLYALTIDKGNTIWEKFCAEGVEISTLGNKVFFGGVDARLWMGNILTGHLDSLLFIPASIKQNHTNCEVIQTLPYITSKKDTLIVVSFILSRNSEYSAWYLLYNLNKRQIVYSQNILPYSRSMNGIFGSIILEQNKLYFAAARSILSYDIKTGKQLWKKDFQGSLLCAGMSLYENRIIVHCDETPQYTYALQPLTGEQIWRERSAGTNSHPFYLRGNIYFTGGSDGLLHAINLKSGKHLWKIVCPEYKENINYNFYGDITGADDRVFVRGGKYLYCYQVFQ